MQGYGYAPITRHENEMGIPVETVGAPRQPDDPGLQFPFDFGAGYRCTSTKQGFGGPRKR